MPVTRRMYALEGAVVTIPNRRAFLEWIFEGGGRFGMVSLTVDTYG